MRKALLLLGIVLVGFLAWMAAGTHQIVDATTPRLRSAPPASRPPASSKIETTTPVPTMAPPSTPPPASSEAAAPADLIATDTTPVISAPPVAETAAPQSSSDAPRPLIVPVAGVPRSAIHDMFNEMRGNRRHEAVDILAPRGTPVIATDDGVVKKIFTSVPGGLTVYQFDPDQRYCYYYAHLDRYAAGLHEGQPLRRGEIVGYVGTTGNAPKDTPHLHFALIRLDPDRRWWKGTYVNPYPLLAGGQ